MLPDQSTLSDPSTTSLYVTDLQIKERWHNLQMLLAQALSLASEV